MQLLKPLIEQRADPFVFKHTDGAYYFTASVPQYDRIEVRRSTTVKGLATAEPVVVWTKPDTGAYSDLIWAPEIHFLRGAWYIYFAAAPSREIKDNLFQHRMYVLRCDGADPLRDPWSFRGQVVTDRESFCLDATAFEYRGTLYYLWAQKDPAIPGNSNLYLARMENPERISGQPVCLSRPEFDWETIGFAVNEGPAFLHRHGRVFITYSASATDHNYCLGLLWADEAADLLDPRSWHKSERPIFCSCHEHRVFGPGHSCFTVTEDGQTDLLVYHGRTYTEIVGDPLWDPNRHTFVKPIRWDERGFPVLGRPSCVD